MINVTRRGYYGEYKVRQELNNIYGEQNVIKVAIGQFGGDFLILDGNKIIKIIEVKETHATKYYNNAREKLQISRIISFCEEKKISFDLWINYTGHDKKMTKIKYLDYENVNESCRY